MLRRISAAIEAGRSAVGNAQTGSSLATSPVEASWALIYFGDRLSIGPRIAAHHAFCKGRGFRCIVLSDDIPAVCIGSRELLFEFVPWPARTALSTPGGLSAATEHTFRRLSLILTFWQVVGCDWADPPACELLDLAPAWAHPVVRASRSTKGNPSQLRECVLPSQ